MKVSILIISHDEIGTAYQKAVETTYEGVLPLPIFTVNIRPDTDPDQLIPNLKKLIKEINHGAGVLILTDLFGATPNNIAQEIQNNNARIVTGLNLPMLIRIMNYPDSSLDTLVEYAIQAGQAGIIECECEN